MGVYSKILVTVSILGLKVQQICKDTFPCKVFTKCVELYSVLYLILGTFVNLIQTELGGKGRIREDQTLN